MRDLEMDNIHGHTSTSREVVSVTEVLISQVANEQPYSEDKAPSSSMSNKKMDT